MNLTDAKVEEWMKQQVKYTEEILFLRDLIIEDQKEIEVWRDEYVKMLKIANEWKQRWLHLKGII